MSERSEVRKTRARGLRVHLRSLARLLAAALALSTLLSFAGSDAWLPDLSTNFRAVYVAVAAALLVAAMLLRLPLLALSLACVVVANATPIVPFYAASPARLPDEAPGLRLLHFNVRLDNRESGAEIARYVRASGAQLALFVETDGRWIEALSGALAGYVPVVSIADPAFNVYFGTALFVRRDAVPRLTVKSAAARLFDERRAHPSLVAELTFAGRPISLVGVHMHPPISPGHTRIRDSQFRGVAEHLRRARGAGLVLGDMNASPWSAAYRRLADGAGLENAQLGFGLRSTWFPLGDALFGLPIDHCLHGDELAVRSFSVGPSLGSDHRPLLVELGWRR